MSENWIQILAIYCCGQPFVLHPPTSNFKMMFLCCVHVTGTPKHVDYEKVKRDLISVPGVRNAHSLHIWSLTLNKTALAAHLVLGKLVCTASLSLFHMLHILSQVSSLLPQSTNSVFMLVLAPQLFDLLQIIICGVSPRSKTRALQSAYHTRLNVLWSFPPIPPDPLPRPLTHTHRFQL